MTSPDLVMTGSYNNVLVVVSVLIPMLGAYAAVDLAGRVTDTRGGERLVWLIGGATASGINTWSMHYTGMAAFSLPVPVWYDWPTVLLSLIPAVCAAAVALFLVSRTRMGWLQTVLASVFMGGGIAALHYTAMASMRFQGSCRYSPVLVTLSVVSAILLSLMPLRMLFLFRNKAGGQWLWKASSLLLMGGANPVMHYTGMAATTFMHSAEVPDLSYAVNVSPLGVAGIITVALMASGVAMLTSLVDRLQRHRALLDELFEQAPQAVVLIESDDRIVRVNRDFTRIFGYTPQEAVGRRLRELIVPEELRIEEQTFHDLVASGNLVETEAVRQRKDSSRLDVSVLRLPIFLPGGQTVVYAIFRDITDRKRMESELLRSFEQLRALAARLQSVREEERTRVAREVHDELGQALTAIKIDLASLIRDLPVVPEESRRTDSILKLINETIHSVRRISAELRPGILDDLGLVAAIEWASEEFEARTGIKCQLDLPQDDIVTDQERVTALFRIFQETLTNIARHANATTIKVLLARENSDLILEVKDDGKGVSVEELSAGSSLGILGMRERALLLGGELIITGGPGEGTTVRVCIPETRRTEPG